MVPLSWAERMKTSTATGDNAPRPTQGALLRHTPCDYLHGMPQCLGTFELWLAPDLAARLLFAHFWTHMFDLEGKCI